MSGARIVLHLALELKRRGGGVGAAALCGGGGQGDALIVRVPSADPFVSQATGAASAVAAAPPRRSPTSSSAPATATRGRSPG